MTGPGPVTANHSAAKFYCDILDLYSFSLKKCNNKCIMAKSIMYVSFSISSYWASASPSSRSLTNKCKCDLHPANISSAPRRRKGAYFGANLATVAFTKIVFLVSNIGMWVPLWDEHYGPPIICPGPFLLYSSCRAKRLLWAPFQPAVVVGPIICDHRFS